MVLVSLAWDNHYLRLPPEGDRRLCGDATTIDEHAVFERVRLGHDRVALQTLDGSFLTMRPDPGQNFGLYPAEELTPAAAFEEVLWPSGHISLRSAELTYVAVDGPTRVVTVNRTEAPLNARLSYVRPPGFVPQQRTAYAPVGEAVPVAVDASRGSRV